MFPQGFKGPNNQILGSRIVSGSSYVMCLIFERAYDYEILGPARFSFEEFPVKSNNSDDDRKQRTTSDHDFYSYPSSQVTTQVPRMCVY